MTAQPLDTGYTRIDVKNGRKALAKKIKSGKTFRVHMVVDLDAQHSDDDGVSIEFSGAVVEATIKENG